MSETYVEWLEQRLEELQHASRKHGELDSLVKALEEANGGNNPCALEAAEQICRLRAEVERLTIKLQKRDNQ